MGRPDADAPTGPKTKPPTVGRGLSIRRRAGFPTRPRRSLFVFGRNAVDFDNRFQRRIGIFQLESKLQPVLVDHLRITLKVKFDAGFDQLEIVG